MDIFNIYFETSTLAKIMIAGVLGFAISMLLQPLYTHIAHKYKWWKKPRTTTVTGQKAVMFQKLHAAKHKRNISAMAGLIVLTSVVLVTLFTNMSVDQTALLLASMIGGGLIGLLDDAINVRGAGKGIAGLQSKMKMLLLIILTFLGGMWFFKEMDVTSFYVPGLDDVFVGWLIVPIFMFVVIATANAVNITDGLDGLAGGLLSYAFTAYSVIALLQGNYGIAAFCMTIVGALVAFNWYNINPAKFFMGDAGSFSLGVALGVVAMVTDTLVLLPLIGLIFVAEVSSVILQLTSKKLRNGKKIFKISPVHHHFEAIGWPEARVTMRFWMIGQVLAVFGVVFAILGGFI